MKQVHLNYAVLIDGIFVLIDGIFVLIDGIFVLILHSKSLFLGLYRRYNIGKYREIYLEAVICSIFSFFFAGIFCLKIVCVSSSRKIVPRYF